MLGRAPSPRLRGEVRLWQAREIEPMSTRVALDSAHSSRSEMVPPVVSRSPAYEGYLRALRRRTRSIQAWQLGLVVVFLVLWEVGPRANWINPMLTSYPSA